MKDNGGLLFDTCKDCLKFISEKNKYVKCKEKVYYIKKEEDPAGYDLIYNQNYIPPKCPIRKCSSCIRRKEDEMDPEQPSYRCSINRRPINPKKDMVVFGCPYPYKIKPGETKCQE